MRRAAALVLLVALGAAGCGRASGPTFPPIGVTPPPAGDTTAATRSQVIGALGAAGLQATDASRPYRPPEGARLAGAPRSVLQVLLADDPDHGFIVIYPFDSPAAATEAAQDQAAYIASNTGRIQFPQDARFVLQVVGSNVVFFPWSPGASPDPKVATIAQALSTVGSAVPIPG